MPCNHENGHAGRCASVITESTFGVHPAAGGGDCRGTGGSTGEGVMVRTFNAMG